MQRRHFLALGTAAALPALSLAQSAKPVPLKFTLDFRISGQTAPFFVALAKGYYAQEGLAPSFDVGSGSVAAITRVASGAYDMGFGDLSALMEFQAAQGPLVQAVYQYYNRAPFVIIARKDRGVSDFKSLAGKRIAAAAVESTRRAWPIAARHAGLKSDSFEWVTTDFSQRDNVIVRGDVDGATYFHDSALSLFQRIDPAQLAVLSYADVGASLYGNAILASSKLTTERPEIVRAFLRATPPRHPGHAGRPAGRHGGGEAAANPWSTRSWKRSASPSPPNTWSRPTRARTGSVPCGRTCWNARSTRSRRPSR